MAGTGFEVVLKAALPRLASRAPVPVFPLAGMGYRDAVRRLALRPELNIVETPRAAAILLVAGELPDALVPAAIAAHDALSRPRATVLWMARTPPARLVTPFVDAVIADDDPTGVIVKLHEELMSGRRASDPPLLPNVDPAPWRGVGPYRQGGLGMTGGVPYGRPLAGRADDRDGLALDQLPVRVGPFLPPLPPGLVLDLKLNGDVIDSVEIVLLGQWDHPDVQADVWQDPFRRALVDPVPIAELEVARAQSHLAWLSDALRAHGLQALAQRALRLSVGLGAGDIGKVRSLGRAVRRSGATSWSTSGLGVVDPALLRGLGAGPVARAGGLEEDARSVDPAYSQLRFEPVVNSGSDVAARWRQRLREAVHSLEIASAAGEAASSPAAGVESPRGKLETGSHPSGRLLEVLPKILKGREWGDAVATITSLDLDIEGIDLPGGLALRQTVA